MDSTRLGSRAPAGDREIAKNFDAYFAMQAFRYVNNNDIGIRDPFRSMSYSHLGTFEYFDAEGTQRDDISWWDKVVDRMKGQIENLLTTVGDGVQNHSMANYLTCLEKAKGN